MTIFSSKLVFLLRCLCLAALAILVIEVVRAFQPKGAPVPKKATVPSPNEVGIRIAPEQLDFGEVFETPQFSWTLTIENLRDKEVDIKEFASSCNCTSVTPKSLALDPGQKGAIHLSLDLTSEKNKFPGGPVHDFAVMISPRLADQAGEVSLGWWRLQGRVRSTIRFDRPLVDFGRNCDAAQPLPPQKARILSDLPLRNLTATSESPSFKVQVKRLPNAGNPFELTVLPSQLPIGELSFRVHLTPVAESGEELPGKWLPVTGRVVSDFQASPSAILLGARRVGESVQEGLTLYSLTSRPFDVEEAACTGTGLVVEKAAQGQANDNTFIVNQQVAGTGFREGKIIFRLRARTGRKTELVVPLSYLGIVSE